MIARINLLSEEKRKISNEKVRQIGGLVYAVSSTFASGAVFFAEPAITDSLEKHTLLPDDAELARILIRKMFSARDADPDGKENYQLLQRLLYSMYYPARESFDNNFVTELSNARNEFESVKALRKRINQTLKSRRQGAVMCVLIEYYTPVLITMLRYAFDYGTTERHERVKEVYAANKKRDKQAKLYLEYHDPRHTTHIGYHVFRTLLAKHEYYKLKEIASEDIKLFLDVMEDFEKLLLIKTGPKKERKRF